MRTGSITAAILIAAVSDCTCFESLIGLLTPSLDAQAKRYSTKLRNSDHKVQVVTDLVHDIIVLRAAKVPRAPDGIP